MGLKKLINNWAIKRAKALEKIADEKTEIRILQFEKERNSRNETEGKIRAAIIESLEPVEQKMIQTGFHIQKGQRAILNKYSIDFDSSNSWDNGAFALIHHEEFRDNRLIYVTIKKIDIAWDLVYEKIDNFLELTDAIYRIEKFPDEIKTIGERYKERIIMNSRTDSIYKENFGLYPRASFEIENAKFKPNWGLLSYSFLDINSAGGKLTEKLWTLDHEVSVKRNEARELEKEYETEKELSIGRYNSKAT